MPIPGRQVFQEIREAHEQAQAFAVQAESAERNLKGEIERLVSDRGAALLELARHDLPDLRRETIEAAFQEIRGELLQIAERKERTIAELRGRIDRLLATEAEQSGARTQADQRLSEQVANQQRLQEQVQAELKSNSQFTSLSQQAVQAEAELHRDEKRVADVQSGSQEKLPHYERSALFQYLYQRRFLTPEYTNRGWTRRMDRWVSDLIGYPTAKRGYEFLKSTPGLMQKELERRRDEFHRLMTEVERMEAEVAGRVGLAHAIQTAQEARQLRDRLDQQLAETRQLTAKGQGELAGVSQEQCQFYRLALDRYRSFLEATQTAVLEQRAQQTPGSQDDEIVSRIRSLSDQIEKLKPQLQATAAEVATSGEVTDGFEFITRRMQQSSFLDERSHFDDRLNLEQLLTRFRAKALSRDALWTELKQHQEFDRTPTESTVIDIVNHPMTRVLAEAMVQAVGAALQHGVNRSIQRRSGPRSASWPEPGWPDSGSSGPAFPDVQAPVWVNTNPAPSAPVPSPPVPAAPASPPASGGGEYRTTDRF